MAVSANTRAMSSVRCWAAPISMFMPVAVLFRLSASRPWLLRTMPVRFSRTVAMYSSAGSTAETMYLQPGDVVVARPGAGLQPDRRARHPVDQAVEVDLVADHRARAVGEVEIVEQPARQHRADLLEVLDLVEQRAADDGVAHQDRRRQGDRGRALPFDPLDDLPDTAAGVGIEAAQRLGDAIAIDVDLEIGHDEPERPLAVAGVAPLDVVDDGAVVALGLLGREVAIGAQFVDLVLREAHLDQVRRGDPLAEAQERGLVLIARRRR